MVLGLRFDSCKMIETVCASVDVLKACIKVSRRRGFLPSFNTHPRGCFTKRYSLLGLCPRWRELSQNRCWSSTCLCLRDGVFYPELQPKPRCSKMITKTNHEHLERDGYKDLTSLPLLLSFNTHLLDGFTKKCTRKSYVCADGAFFKKTNQNPYVFLERRRPLPKNNQRSFDVPKTFQPRSHEHVERVRYKSPSSLPLLLSFNSHLSGCFTKMAELQSHVFAGAVFQNNRRTPPCLLLRSHSFTTERWASTRWLKKFTQSNDESGVVCCGLVKTTQFCSQKWDIGRTWRERTWCCLQGKRQNDSKESDDLPVPRAELYERCIKALLLPTSSFFSHLHSLWASPKHIQEQCMCAFFLSFSKKPLRKWNDLPLFARLSKSLYKLFMRALPASFLFHIRFEVILIPQTNGLWAVASSLPPKRNARSIDEVCLSPLRCPRGV